MRKEIKEVLDRSKELREEAEMLLKSVDGSIIDLTEWITIPSYAKKFGKSTHQVHNWIRRGIVPAGNVRVVTELDDIRLIRAIPYKEEA
jgi:hypothetical protein